MENNEILENNVSLTDTNEEISVPLKSKNGFSYSLHVKDCGIPYVNDVDGEEIWSGLHSKDIDNFIYADEIVENAMTYWRNSTNESESLWGRGTTYRDSNTPCSGTAKAETGVDGSIWHDCGGKYYKAIDCSTLVLLSLQDYSYENGPYASLENFNAYRENRKKKRSGSLWGLDYPGRSAAEIGEFFSNKGWIVPLDSIGNSSDNWSGLKPGDILFWAKKLSDGTYKKTSAFMKISHTGIVQGISSTTGKLNVIEATHPTSKKHIVNGVEYDAGCIIRSLDNADPEELVLVARMRIE